MESEYHKKEIFDQNKKKLEANMVKSNEKSNNLIESLKKKKFIDIFKMFDSDGDGVISPTKINISAVDTTILEAFAPLLCEMEELSQSLTLEEFLDASERLLKVSFSHLISLSNIVSLVIINRGKRQIARYKEIA